MLLFMLEILFKDESLVAINKPSGLLVHRSPIDQYETRFAMQMTRDQIGQHVYPVHRLDKPTSGVLLFALSSEVASLLSKQFTATTMNKTYWAVVRGYTNNSGVVDSDLQEEWDKMTDNLADKAKAAQSAITHYERLATTELPYPVGRYDSVRYSLVSLQPKTGRKHQLRRHLKRIFHPIVGDTTHGDGKQNAFLREQFGLSRLMLHAKSIGFQHPISGKEMLIEAGVPEDFSLMLEQLKLS
jgi:tRNA pseudouridine65 synthase